MEETNREEPGRTPPGVLGCPGAWGVLGAGLPLTESQVLISGFL